jgi:hypothetical protein
MAGRISNDHFKNPNKPRQIEREDLIQFKEFYINKYNNFYSQRFKHLDLIKNRIANHQIYIEFVRNIVKRGKNPHIVYEIYDNETSHIRVGWSSHSPDERMNWYLMRAFAPELSPDLANIYPEMAKCKSKRHAIARFKMKVRYVFPSKGEAQIMEEFLTIYRNKANNSVGYDLSINNEYNKIIGDLMKKGLKGSFLKGSLNPKWSNILPIPLAKAVLDGLGMGDLTIKFGVDAKTIRRRFKAYGYGVKSIFDLKDARAFLLKPIIIEGFKLGLNQEDFFIYSTNKGIKIFNRYKFTPNKENARGAFFRRILKQIWGTSKHKEARYNVLASYILSAIDRPDIMPGEAENELKNIINFKYEREFARICEAIFGVDFRKKRDEIFKPVIEKSALKNWNERKIQLKIALDIGLCSENDPIEIRERASSWVKSYILRNYGLSTGKLPSHLNPHLTKPKSLKEQVYEHMEQNPIARPKELFEFFQETSTIETIRNYVKTWKKENRDKVYEFPMSLASRYIEEMDLGDEIYTLTSELLHDYIAIEKPALNMEWKGIIAGAIYLACQIIGNPIFQTLLSKFIEVSLETIRIRIREITESLNFSDY